MVLAGDPNQLGPIIQSSLCKSFGFDVSLLERLIRISQKPREEGEGGEGGGEGGIDSIFDPSSLYQSRIFCLVRHYRAHPAIMGLYSKFFYNSHLICETDPKISQQLLKWEGLRPPVPSLQSSPSPVPILFHHVDGKEARDADSPSWYNQQEINVILLFLGALLKSQGVLGGRGGWVEGEDVGVICVYRKQVEKVRWGIKTRFPMAEGIEVGTTESFQVGGCGSV